MKKIILLITTIISSIASFAQKTALPKTDIYLLPITYDKNGIIQVGDGTKITDWDGYNNQPSFSPDDKKILYTSVQADSQADIYSYDMAKKTSSRLIYIKGKKEYSALYTHDKKSISAVQVQEDDSTQYLAEFNKDGQFNKIIFPKINPVGYYCWVSDTTAALFVLGKVFTLQLANTITGKSTVIASNIGRCVQKIHGQNAISFVDKTDSNKWMLKSYVPAVKQFLVMGPTLPKCEDFCYTPDGTYLMGNDGELFVCGLVTDGKWVEVANFSQKPYANFYRIAISHDGKWLAVVSYKGVKP